MALGNIPPHLIDLDELQNCLSSNYMLEALQKVRNETEDMLLAMMAAGVPANCISLVGPNAGYDFKNRNNTINFGFRFMGRVN